MGSEMETAFREFLLDPSFWRPRLARLDRTPRELVLFPRPDLARPGVEVVELRMRGHDGSRLRGLLVRPAFSQGCREVDLIASTFLAPDEIDWERPVRAGASQLLCERVPGRGLEDRVLDLLRFSLAACELEAVECDELRFQTRLGGEFADDVAIAERIRSKGWI